jgi:hypothetical protein
MLMKSMAFHYDVYHIDIYSNPKSKAEGYGTYYEIYFIYDGDFVFKKRVETMKKVDVIFRKFIRASLASKNIDEICKMFGMTC